jgi:hypothetical protein
MAITKLDISMLEDVSGANNLVTLDANAKIPAGTGANLLNKPGPLTSASDPTISSNKTLGTEWLNSASGEMFVCTDATAGANTWTNVGAGSGDVFPYVYGGTQYGYCMGGYAGPSTTDTIQKTSFTSDGNATDVSNLTVAKNGSAGFSSKTYAFSSGGGIGFTNIIEKFSFAAEGNATDVGDLTEGREGHAEASDKVLDYGYSAGGEQPYKSDRIDRFSFTVDGNATDVGNLTVAKSWKAGASSQTHGYFAGGQTATNIIERLAFAATNNSVDVGDLGLNGGHGSGGVTSSTHGYYIRSHSSNPSGQDIQKYAFASSANGSHVGDCPTDGQYKSGSSSTTYGYLMGGRASPASTLTDAIEKFSLSSDGNATTVGDLFLGVNDGQAGTEY